ncbi:hypothetical protein SAMN02927923_03400 [Microvirga guangxiensis]|uniref:Uncharacterized protein n=1 Tax=Microvirga guangxiensis TaxID=549386 RepID=A0A1G5KK93_9HYPH|nr:hypothetical protein SAMN02927923_03400 [Microvirga guangxiensis]
MAGLVHLAEDDLLLRAVQGAPGADTTLEGAADAGAELGMATDDLLEESDGGRLGAACSSGRISLSQTASSGSGRLRPRGAFLCEGKRGSLSMR